MDLRGKGFIDYEEFKKGFNITNPEIVDVSICKLFPNSIPLNIDQDLISDSNLLSKSFCLLH